jgi:cytochrome P450
MTDKPLPPGRTGAPLIGETLAFLENGFGFIEERVKRYGPIFRTRVLMRDTAFIVGADATAKFVDGRHVQRAGAMPPNIEALFGGKSLPILDGEEHLARKTFVMAAFTRDALASYVPRMEEITASYFARWAGAGEMRWLDELKRLALETICRTIMGLPAGDTMEEVRQLYDVIGRGFAALPIPLPGTAFTRAKKALSRVLAIFADNVEKHQAEPRDDGLSRILAARLPNGRAMTVDEAKTELHHIVVAGIIIWGWMVTAIQELDAHPEVKKRLVEEVRAKANGPLTLELLEGMPYLEKVANEIRRTSPVVPVFFGKAREDFEFAGHRIPKDWMVIWGIRASHMRPDIHPEPERFDPERFAPERAEHKKHACAFAPNGAGDAATGHKCAGYEFAPVFLEVFLIEMLRAYDYTIAPGQDLSRDWTKIPPEPKDGLRATVRKA